MNNSAQERSWLSRFLFSLLMVALTFTAIILLFKAFHYAPFGGTSLASGDANIQYIAFFSYLKECWAGRNSIFYSMSSFLGQNNYVVFGYYLCSPVNLLLVFFDRSRLHDFFDIAVALKLALSAGTMAWYLEGRFKGRLHRIYTAVLALSYAWMNYNFMQACNIMWLDGIYMLPLIMLGVYMILEESRTAALTIPVGLAILFNWYIAGLDCLFSILWFAFEALLQLADRRISVWKMTVRTLKYIWAMAIGVLLSAVVFYPTVWFYLHRAAEEADPVLFQDVYFNNFISLVQGFSVGAPSSIGRVVLFCGTLALTGAIAFFLSDRIRGSHKILAAGFALFMLEAFYWRPLSSVFSLFKRADSNWYRYAFLGSFMVIFLSAFLLDRAGEDKKTSHLLLKAAAGFILVLSLAQYVKDWPDLKMLNMTALFTLLAVTAAYGFMRFSGNRAMKILAGLLLLVFTAGELAYNAKVQMHNYRYDEVEPYYAFMNTMEEQVSAIRAQDDSLYRISQTGGREETYDHTMSTYNDILPTNAWTITGYTSNTHLETLTFLDRMGYRNLDNCMSIVDTSILPADSLLGVKYVMSKYPIKGLKKSKKLGETDDRAVYVNPYAMPLAMVWKEPEKSAVPEVPAEEEEKELEYEEVPVPVFFNSFEYINQIYSDLLGEEVTLFRPVSFETDRQSPLFAAYDLSDIPEGAPVYGNLQWIIPLDARLTVKDAYYANYSMWLSPTVFYIPADADTARVTFQAEIYNEDTDLETDLETAKTFLSQKEIRWSKKTQTGLIVPAERVLDALDAQFYYLDLDALKKASRKMKKTEPESLSIENGHIEAEVKAREGESLLLTIPADDGWKITVNGNRAEAGLFADTLMSIPLEEGDNRVELTYEVPGLKVGAVITLAGILLLIFSMVVDGILKRRSREKESLPQGA